MKAPINRSRAAKAPIDRSRAVKAPIDRQLATTGAAREEVRMNTLPTILTAICLGLLSGPPAAAQEEPDLFTAIDLELVADGLISPLFLASPPDDERLFVVDQTGTIHIVDGSGQLLAEPFLDVSQRMVVLRDSYDERGLLGMAFHPEYGENGLFFVVYSAPLRDEGPELWDHTSHLSEFRVSKDDANRADLDSERIVMQVDQPQINHNGGALAFGDDGYLYYSIGDGGDADDTGTGHPPLGNAQDVTTILGNILRIDVNNGDPYGIPDDNPFVGLELPDDHPFSGDGIPPEIWAWGFRHPWRISFDREEAGRLFVSDAGENLWEEVSIVNEPGNYGWNIKEGTHWFDPENAGTVIDEGPSEGLLGEPLIDPIIEYMNNRGRDRGIGVVVIGGYLYRGAAIPELQGHYVFADWSRFFDRPQGVLMVAAPAGDGEPWRFQEVKLLEEGAILGFGEDANGEVYVLSNGSHGPSGENGRVYRVIAAQQDE
jgi:glucose/arabinose dehydrogenase